jgi:MFS family permease
MALFNTRGAVLQQLMLFTIVVPTFLAMGYSQPFLGGIISCPLLYTDFTEINTTTTRGAVEKHNSLTEGVINATLNLGAVMGALPCMYAGNAFGRRGTVFIGAIAGIVGTVLFCSSTTMAQLIIARREQRFGIIRICNEC